MRHFLSALFFLLSSWSALAQTPGQIIRTAVNDSLLDPNGDGWISATTSGFSDFPTIEDESEEFETSWNVLWHYEMEPSSDLQTGSTCGPTELVDNSNTLEHAAYWQIHDPDGIAGNEDELLLFRMRVNSDPNNAAYGYSFLIDTDQKFGSTGADADPNALSGNPGFEFEILFASGNSGGVYVNDVDGIAAHNQITTLQSYADGVNDQRSQARFSNCTGDTPIFIDFFIAFADLGPTVTSNTVLRMLFASASSANSALNGSASDVGGINDDNYLDDDSIFDTFISAVPTIQFSVGYSIVDVDGDGVDDATDNCTDLSACNYNADPTEACATNDACGVCGGSGVDVDSDGICDDVDDCTDATANNYTADPTETCSYPEVFAVLDTIMGCDGQADLEMDLDTLHTESGTWSYTVESNISGFATGSVSGSVLTIDFSAAGVDSAHIEISASDGTNSGTFDFLVIEGSYPYWTDSAPDGGNTPTSPTGGVSQDFEGGYGVPVTVHYYADAVFIEDPAGNYSTAPYGEELTAMTDSSGSLLTLPAGDYWISGYTNQFGCFNPEPAIQATQTAAPELRLITVPHLLPD